MEEIYPDDPPVYHYTYAVEDEYEGANHSAEEESDEYNNIHGSYQVIKVDPLNKKIVFNILPFYSVTVAFCPRWTTRMVGVNMWNTPQGT